jgi:tetratricopeptide (TPR) repeat protein
MKFIGKFGGILKKGKDRSVQDQYLYLLKKEPGNAKAHLKLAEIYQKKGEKQKAISEYLTAADIFVKDNFYARAMAIYKQVPKQDPSLDHVYMKIADIYRKMGFLGDAFAQYRILVQHYDSSGMKDKALEVMSMMAEMDPRKGVLQSRMKEFQPGTVSPKEDDEKVNLGEAFPTLLPAEKTEGEEKETFFDLGAELETGEAPELKTSKEIETLEKIYGFDEIFKELKEMGGPSSADPNFNYNMGIACREMGFVDDAIEQFLIAFTKGQNPFEAAHMLGLCYKEKGMWSEAGQAFEKALKVKGIPKEKILEVKYELGLIFKKQGKKEEALNLLREISAVNQEFRNTKKEISKLKGQAHV